MALSPSRITAILSARHRPYWAALVGLTAGCGIAVAAAYIGTGRLSPDRFTCLIALILLGGWALVLFRIERTSRDAAKLASMLTDPENIRLRFDSRRDVLAIERVETVDVGFAPAEAVSARAEVSRQEAELLGMAMDGSPRRRLFLSGGRADGCAPAQMVDVSPSVANVGPTPAAP